MLLAFSAGAQSYSFRSFSAEDGLSHPFVYDIEQDEKGYLWVATGEGLCRFNGFRFKSYFKADGLAEDFVSTIYKDSEGSLWLGHKQGDCTVMRNGEFEQIQTGKHFNSLIRAMREDLSGNIWIMSQHSGMIRMNSNGEMSPLTSPFAQLLLFDFQITERGQMLVGTHEGLYLYRINAQTHDPEFIDVVDDIPFTRVNCITKGSIHGQYFVGTEDEGAYRLQIRNNNRIIVEHIAPELGLDRYNIQHIIEDDDNSLWVATFGKGLLQLALNPAGDEFRLIGHFDKSNGLDSDEVKTVFRDREGNLWAGKFGGNRNSGGISSLTNNAFVFYQHPSGTEGAVSSIHGNGQNMWFGLENEVMLVEQGQHGKPIRFGENNGLKNGMYNAVFVDNLNRVWAGNATSGLFMKNPGDSIFQFFELSKDILSQHINDITGNEENIWIATKNGIYALDLLTHNVQYYNQSNGLEHNVVRSLYLDEKNNLWYCTASAYLSYIKNGNIVNIALSEEMRVHDQTDITKDSNGNIWLATNGGGVFVFDYDQVHTVNHSSHGLKSNFCYSIEVDYTNKVWIGHKGGLSCYNPASDHLVTMGRDEDLAFDFLPNATFCDRGGQLWFGTKKNYLRYNPSKDLKNSIPPIINIEAVQIEDDFYAGLEAQLPFGHYRTRFQFLGLSFRKSDAVTYKYILEGHDRDWHEITTQNEAYYSKIDPGTYTFKVVAFNSDGIKSLGAAEFHLFIQKPFWQRAWFILTAIASAIVLVIMIIKIRERRQKLVRKYLKKTLDIRTREVQAKSAELERKNKDITASIHYAKKIQDATLPPEKLLKESFPDSFIFYRPRDIVSGDFYWFRQFGDKLLISVADCTGHGVPGALLSMIGSTKMSSIAGKQEVRTPNAVVQHLDEELRTLLQQTNFSNGPQDGMDLVVCEIDLKTRYLRLCAAMSHVYISTANGIEKIEGDRNPIGGNHLGREKLFTMHERQMNPGETLFLATDGYQDQFGGEHGKKLKRSGFLDILSTVGNLPSENQGEAMANHFAAWSKGHEQVDDVLVVGLKF